ncbi:MAG TPA: hypothetical protein PLQ44_01290 [Candidatus Paceibacterota bacterium]|nr:hypothetical protein [Candidatus Paceibacterota bacterium]HPT40221.1 hypothetical protein [Candidatus Paceibacterota bacterium]
MRHNIIISLLVVIILFGQVSPIFAAFDINNNEPIIAPDLVNPEKLKNMLPESVKNLINGAEDISSDVVQDGADIVTGEKDVKINPAWWQNAIDSIKKAWDKINTVVDVKGFLTKIKDVVIVLVKTIWEFFRGIFTYRVISQFRA